MYLVDVLTAANNSLSSSFPDVCTAGSALLNYLNDGPTWQMFIFKIKAYYDLPAKYNVSGETEWIRNFVHWEWMDKKKTQMRQAITHPEGT